MAVDDNTITADPITISNPNPLYPQQQPQQGMGAGVALGSQARQQVQQQNVDPMQYMKSNLAQGIEVQKALLNLSQDPRVPVNIDQAQKYANSLGIGLPSEEEMKQNVAAYDAATADADAKTKALFEAQHKAHPGQLGAALGLTAIGLGLPAAVFARMMQSKNLGTKPQDAEAAQALATSLANKLKGVREGDLHAITGLKEANEMMLQVHDRTIAQNKAFIELGTALTNQARQLVANPQTGLTNSQQANETSRLNAINAQAQAEKARNDIATGGPALRRQHQQLENQKLTKDVNKPEPPAPLDEGTKAEIEQHKFMAKHAVTTSEAAAKSFNAQAQDLESQLQFTKEPAKKAILQTQIDGYKQQARQAIQEGKTKSDDALEQIRVLSGSKYSEEPHSYAQSSSARALKESSSPSGQLESFAQIARNESLPMADRIAAAKRYKELKEIADKGK